MKCKTNVIFLLPIKTSVELGIVIVGLGIADRGWELRGQRSDWDWAARQPSRRLPALLQHGPSLLPVLGSSRELRAKAFGDPTSRAARVRQDDRRFPRQMLASLGPRDSVIPAVRPAFLSARNDVLANLAIIAVAAEVRRGTMSSWLDASLCNRMKQTNCTNPSGSVVLFRRGKTVSSFLQVLGATCLVVVVLTHVCEGLHLLPWMHWGLEH